MSVFLFPLFYYFITYTPKYVPRQSLELSIALTQLPRAGIIGMHHQTTLSYCFLKDILLLLYKKSP